MNSLVPTLGIDGLIATEHSHGSTNPTSLLIAAGAGIVVAVIVILIIWRLYR